jgi:hypothetical protein
MKIYGNARSDGFPLLLSLIGVVFVLGGVGLSKVGGVAMLAGLVAFAALAAVMILKLRRYDVMSDVAAPGTEPVMARPSFPVAAASDTTAEPAVAAWSPSNVSDAGLPTRLEKPKSVVETNTAVA